VFNLWLVRVRDERGWGVWGSSLLLCEMNLWGEWSEALNGFFFSTEISESVSEETSYHLER